MDDFKYMTKEDELIFLRFSNPVALDANEDDYRDYLVMLDRERHGHSSYLGASPADWWVRGHGRVFA